MNLAWDDPRAWAISTKDAVSGRARISGGSEREENDVITKDVNTDQYEREQAEKMEGLGVEGILEQLEERAEEVRMASGSSHPYHAAFIRAAVAEIRKRLGP
jgi:hypothetical protein